MTKIVLSWETGTLSVEQISEYKDDIGSVQCSVSWDAGATAFASLNAFINEESLLEFMQSTKRVVSDLSGSATLHSMEGDVEITLELKDGKGSVRGRLELPDSLGSLEFYGPTDQSLVLSRGNE